MENLKEALKNINLLQYLAKIKVENAINPLLWLVGIVFPISITSFVFTQRIEMVYLAMTPIFFVGIAYGYFMLRNPDYLLSEEHQLEKRAMELLGKKGKELSSEKIQELKALPKPSKSKKGLIKIK